MDEQNNIPLGFYTETVVGLSILVNDINKLISDESNRVSQNAINNINNGTDLPTTIQFYEALENTTIDGYIWENGHIMTFDTQREAETYIAENGLDKFGVWDYASGEFLRDTNGELITFDTRLIS